MRAQKVILVFFHLHICFQFLLFWFEKKKTKAAVKKDKSHQAEQRAVNQTSSSPAHDEALFKSAQHMVDKFS